MAGKKIYSYFNFHFSQWWMSRPKCFTIRKQNLLFSVMTFQLSFFLSLIRYPKFLFLKYDLVFLRCIFVTFLRPYSNNWKCVLLRILFVLGCSWKIGSIVSVIIFIRKCYDRVFRCFYRIKDLKILNMKTVKRKTMYRFCICLCGGKK